MVLSELKVQVKNICSFGVVKEALVLVFSNLKHDARVLRQVHWLRKKYRVTVVCFDAPEIAGVRFITIKQTNLSLPRKALLGTALLLRAYAIAYRIFHPYGQLVIELKNKFDVIIANDIDCLPLAFELKGKGHVVFDAHEYAPRHFENNSVWKTFFQPFYIHLCKKFIPKTSGMLTVGKGLADEYKKQFGVQPVIITNASRYVEIEPTPVNGGDIRLVHHGIANPSRRLELMIEMMDHLDERFSLHMILMTSDYASEKTRTYIHNLKEKAERHPRIKILDPVKSEEVVPSINKYDIGVFLIPPINFNYANTLPNKLFDFIQARLAIAIGPTPEMAAIVRSFGNGVVSEDFTATGLARQLKQLSVDDIIAFKKQSAQAATQLNAEKNEVIFNRLLESLT